MENSALADHFSLLSRLSEIHGENSFKAKSYATASFNIEKLPMPLNGMQEQKIAALQGIGASTAQKISELLQTGRLASLDALLQKTPQGILEMMNIKGIGPKKISAIWKEMGIETIGELRYACEENRLKDYKGFGEKTQQTILENITYYQQHQGHFLYAQIESFALELTEKLRALLPGMRLKPCGAIERHLETIDELEWVTDTHPDTIRKVFLGMGGFTPLQPQAPDENSLRFQCEPGIRIRIHYSGTTSYPELCYRKSCSPEFASFFESCFGNNHLIASEDAADLFAAAGVPYIPPIAREADILEDLLSGKELPEHLTPESIRGIIHCHSNWSDGSDPLEKMAEAAKEKGYDYMVISDHSKSAFYANGLQEERIAAQHRQIDELNARLTPFRIFKGIECDILNEGQLDYSPEVLCTFEVVIASIHSNLSMTEDKAMMRLLRAIENPYTTILGHMTGRLLLSRKGYPVDHRRIIDACAANGVAIELNANPSRLDIDWRHIRYALSKGVMLSINPDAHHIAGFEDTRYGVLVAQKALLQASQNLSSHSLAGFEAYLEKAHRKRP
jgi:DNA polymerase (family 10)